MPVLSRKQPTPLPLGAALVLALAALAATPARASLVIEAPSFTAASGTTGSFDVIVRDTDAAGSPAYNVANADLDLSVSGTGIHFTTVTIGTVSPYIFVTPGSTGSDLNITPLPATTFHSTDNEFASPGYRAVGPGDVFGLAHVSYSIDAGATPGVRTLTFNVSTDLDDITGVSLRPTFTPGAITITGAATAVPEPSMLGLAVGGAVALVFAQRRLRRDGVVRRV